MTTVAGTAAGGFAWIFETTENEELKESNTSHQAQQPYTTTNYVAVFL